MSTGHDQTIDVQALAELLREAEANHGAFEAAAPKHSWADWYAPFVAARLDGRSADEAVAAADRRMRDEFDIARR